MGIAPFYDVGIQTSGLSAPLKASLCLKTIQNVPSVPQNDPRVLWMLSAAIALGYMYQGPPFRCLPLPHD